MNQMRVLMREPKNGLRIPPRSRGLMPGLMSPPSINPPGLMILLPPKGKVG